MLGVAYKKDVSELRESPALDSIHLLEEKGAKVSYHDPHVPAFQHEGMEMVGVTDLDLALRLADCVVIVTDHSAYEWEFIAAYQERLVDTRHMIGDKRWDKRTLTGAAAADAVSFIRVRV